MQEYGDLSSFRVSFIRGFNVYVHKMQTKTQESLESLLKAFQGCHVILCSTNNFFQRLIFDITQRSQYCTL